MVKLYLYLVLSCVHIVCPLLLLSCPPPPPLQVRTEVLGAAAALDSEERWTVDKVRVPLQGE